MIRLLYCGFFVFRIRYYRKLSTAFRKLVLGMQGMKIGTGCTIPKMFTTWPHQVQIGNNCLLEHDVYLKYDGIYKEGPSIIIGDDVFVGSGCEFNCTAQIKIGRYCKIASGSRFIDHDHGIKRDELIRSQISIDKPILLEEDVWVGANAVILKGVTIGKGAIVGASAVVTKSIPPYEIWAGVPARKIGERV